MTRATWTTAVVASLAAAGCGGSPQKRGPDGGGGTGGSAAICADDAARGDGTIASIAPIVIRSCAKASCHDAIKHEHGMDLSTAHLIYQNWVGQKGLDHCTNKPALRVVPGDPDNSFVMTKIQAPDVICNLGTRMPPPPASMLSACEIEAVHRWITAGAPGPLGSTDAATDVASDTGDGDAADDGGGDDGSADVPDPGSCTSTTPCDPDTQVCVEEAPSASGDCYTRWECYAHAPPGDTLEHACPAETAVFCGCDGSMFEASYACPNRPYDHIGACGDGYSCDIYRVRCADVKPTCPAGQEPAVVAGCWGPCVPIAMCRCDQAWRCPQGYRCVFFPDFRCGVAPPPSDAGAGAD